MTATIRLFREVLSDKALINSTTTEEARQIVARAEQNVERYKSEIAHRESQPTPALSKPAASGRS